MIKTAFFLALISLSLQAEQTIVRRQVNQQSRINQGVRSGTLTAPEAARLQVQQNALGRQVARDRVDGGGLSAAERARIDRRQDQQSRRIARQKADGQTRR